MEVAYRNGDGRASPETENARPRGPGVPGEQRRGPQVAADHSMIVETTPATPPGSKIIIR
jgi:hypothetical protein